MQILIINPPAANKIKYIREGRCEQRLSSFQYTMPPISLLSIAGLMEREKFEVKILDCISEELDFADIKREINAFAPALIIINISTATYYSDLEIVKLIRDITSCHITAIGVHVSVLPEIVLKESLLDSTIIGEPELTCLKLAKAIEKKSSLKEIEAVSFKDDGKIIHNPRISFMEDLDKLPFPARHLVKNKNYILPLINRPYTLIISSRGCPYECIFCTARQYYGNKIRLRNSKGIADEAVEVIHKFNIKDIVMWSDTFTLVRSNILEICDEIKKRNLKFNWMCNSRVDKVDEVLLKEMKEAGCSGISYGVESGVQAILDKAKKAITLKQIEDAFKWTHQAKIQTLAHVIFGLPGETKSTIKITLNFVKKINPDFAQFYCAIPFPGTELYSLSEENGWLITDDWSRFELNQAVVNTPGLSAKDLAKARKQAFLSFYLRPLYLTRRVLPKMVFSNWAHFLRQSKNFLNSWIES